MLSKSCNQACLFNNEAAIFRHLAVIDIDVEVCCFTCVIKALRDCDYCVTYPRFHQEAVFRDKELVVECWSSNDWPHWRNINIFVALQTAISIPISDITRIYWNYLGYESVKDLYITTLIVYALRHVIRKVHRYRYSRITRRTQISWEHVGHLCQFPDI